MEQSGSPGRYFEDFTVGDSYRHALGRTVTEADNTLFTMLTMNPNPIHFDAEYAKRTEFGRILVNSCFTLALVVGQSVADLGMHVMANLGWDEVRLPKPVFIGDTIRARSEIESVRASRSRPDVGIVTARTAGENQRGETVITLRPVMNDAANTTIPSSSPFEEELRARTRVVCERFDAAYWRDCDRRRIYPEEFVRALGATGLLAAPIPRAYGGLGAGLAQTCAIVEEINRHGGNAGTAHAQLYTMATILRHGTDEQRAAWLPPIARGELRLQAFGVTEADAGSDTTQITTSAVRMGDRYVVNGRKRWTSRLQHADAMLLLARTAPYDPQRRTAGLSVFFVDMRDAAPGSIEATPIDLGINNLTNDVVLRDLTIPVAHRIGAEGEGFRCIVDGWNAERILIAAECVGHGRCAIERAAAYASERVVFGKPLGANQSVQFPLARAHADAVYSNLRGDMPERLGLRYADLRESNPRIVCVSLSGYGMSGPRQAEPSYDAVIQGLAGWQSLTGDPTSPPTRSGLSMVDFSGGFVAALALLAGIHAARRDGVGCDCDTSLFDTAIHLLGYIATWTAAERGWLPQRHPLGAHPSVVPFQNFRTADSWIVIVCAKEKFFRGLVDALQIPEVLEDPRFVDMAARREHREEVIAVLQERLATRTTAEWLRALSAAGVPCAPINDVAQALTDPQTIARDDLVTVEHPRFGAVHQVRSPVRVGAAREALHRGPRLGEDTTPILRELLGYDDARIEAARAAGAFGRP